MARIQYKDFQFKSRTVGIIEQANEIIHEYREQGYDLTLRQLYYQFVARGLIPNNDREYKNLGSIINDGRLAGLIDWSAITDRTRPNRGNSHWDSPQEIIEAVAEQFRIDTRQDQPYYIEVWVEKDALIGIVQQACTQLDIPYMSCRGYVSQSSMWEAARRFVQMENDGRETILIHLGDHDPSGIDMTRDIQERLVLFNSECRVDRIALDMRQIEAYTPPPNPAKITDSRSGDYIRRFGQESWELDALDPRVITELIEKNVDDYTDEKKLKRRIVQQTQHRVELSNVAKRWTEITKSFKRGK